ncbi:unnamed protein product [Brachionus calyciflorus]|uniref:Neuroblastoma-amplified sequence N-terminal domain-containing protein n=1 Tax=Brachionus calyciflorus TaxID=104777 RepID=A0A814LIZ9_9BILA|nr:unnamed protein product [Brachionus calyciflorus]
MSESSKDSVILYDINTYSFPNWISEIDKDDNIYVKYQKSQNSGNVLSRFGSWMKGKFRFGSNENALKFIFTSSKPWNGWKLAVSDSESFGLLRENMIEFYESLESKFTWRTEVDCKYVRICNLFFNKQIDHLVFTNELGNIYFYDIKDGKEAFRYIEQDESEFDDAICKLFFIDVQEIKSQNIKEDVIQLIMVLTYSGYFKVFTLSHNRSIDLIYTQSLLNIVPNGIYCAEIDSKLEYLIIGSFASSSYKQNTNGLHIFRILNTEPWIKHVKIINDVNLNSNKLNDKNFAKANFTKIEYVTKIEISPDNTSLAAIYVSGKIDIYTLPTLKLLKEWFMTEQPNYNEMNSAIVESPYEWKKFKQIYHESDFRVVDIGWWNTKVLILTRGTGLLSLVSSDNLANLMGRNQQWLSPFPSIYRYSENEFILLDCQCALSSHSSNYDLMDNDDENSELNLSESNELSNQTDEDDYDDDDEDSWVTYLTQGIKSQAYNLIGIQGFKGPDKKTKFLRRKFSIMHIKSTTPEELFERKLKSEEYGEALKLAETYNLDTDLVYKQQWNSKPISKSTINDYLLSARVPDRTETVWMVT